MKNKKVYFTTGEFAALCNVGKDTLYHYDKVGVFSPQYIGENGYRYYHAMQYDTFLVIDALCDLGMTLKDIKEYLNNRSPKNFTELMERQMPVIDEKIRKLENIKKIFIEKKTNIASFEEKRGVVFETYQEEDEEYFCSEELGSFDDVEMVTKISRLIDKNLLTATYNTVGFVSEPVFYENEIRFENSRFYLKPINRAFHTASEKLVKKKGKYLSVYHTGGYEKIEKSYRILYNYSHENGLVLEKEFFEEETVDLLAVKTSNETVVRISVKVLE